MCKPIHLQLINENLLIGCNCLMGHDAEVGMDDREGSTKSYSPSQNKVNNEGANDMIMQ